MLDNRRRAHRLPAATRTISGLVVVVIVVVYVVQGVQNNYLLRDQARCFNGFYYILLLACSNFSM